MEDACRWIESKKWTNPFVMPGNSTNRWMKNQVISTNAQITFLKDLYTNSYSILPKLAELPSLVTETDADDIVITED